MQKRKGMPPDPLDYAVMAAIVLWFCICVFVPQATALVRLSAMIAGCTIILSAERYQ